jgi:hypothetical protein
MAYFPSETKYMTSSAKVIDVGVDFTRYPAGRTMTDGPFCGEAFRDRFLRPQIEKHLPIVVKLDSALAYGSSFLEEAFGGLVRMGFQKDEILKLIQLETTDRMLKNEIESYIKTANATA